MHRSLGLGVALLILPGRPRRRRPCIILVSGAIWAPAAARVLDTSLRYTVDKTTREVLFLPLPSDVKRRAKPFIDVTIDRMAKALGALLMLVLIKPWGLNLDWRQLSYASLVFMGAVDLRAAMVVRREYLASFRQQHRHRAMRRLPFGSKWPTRPRSRRSSRNWPIPTRTAVLYAIDFSRRWRSGT